MFCLYQGSKYILEYLYYLKVIYTVYTSRLYIRYIWNNHWPKYTTLLKYVSYCYATAMAITIVTTTTVATRLSYHRNPPYIVWSVNIPTIFWSGPMNSTLSINPAPTIFNNQFEISILSSIHVYNIINIYIYIYII